MKINPDDPLLTAYALGELDALEKSRIEADLAGDEEALRIVEEIRAVAASLSLDLSREITSGLGEKRRGDLIARIGDLSQGNAPRTPVYHVLTHPIRERHAARRFFAAAGLAAALILAVGAVAIIFSNRRPAPPMVQTPHGSSPVGFSPFVTNINNDPWTQTIGSGSNVAAFTDARSHPTSLLPLTTSRDSYTELAHTIEGGALPRPEQVRIADMVNAVTYHYKMPLNDIALAADMEIADCPWAAGHRLVRIGLASRAADAGEKVDATSLVASNVTARVEFFPENVASYRLLGIVPEDATGSSPDQSAGSPPGRGITYGWQYTALYEIIPANSGGSNGHENLLTLHLEYTQTRPQLKPCEDDIILSDGSRKIDKSSEDFRFAAAVASFGVALRQPTHPHAADLDRILSLADAAKGTDLDGSRGKFIDLVKKARGLCSA